MIKAKYKKWLVKGRRFVLGDSEWLLLDKKSTKLTGKEAVSYDDKDLHFL